MGKKIQMGEVVDMDKQTIEFSVRVKNGTVTAIGKSYIIHPEIRFNGNSVKWYNDKKKNKI